MPINSSFLISLIKAVPLCLIGFQFVVTDEILENLMNNLSSTTVQQPFWISTEVEQLHFRKECISAQLCAEPRFTLVNQMPKYNERLSHDWSMSKAEVPGISLEFFTFWGRGFLFIGIDPKFKFSRTCDESSYVSVFQFGAKVKGQNDEVYEKVQLELHGQCFNATLTIQLFRHRCPWCLIEQSEKLFAQLKDTEPFACQLPLQFRTNLLIILLAVATVINVIAFVVEQRCSPCPISKNRVLTTRAQRFLPTISEEFYEVIDDDDTETKPHIPLHFVHNLKPPPTCANSKDSKILPNMIEGCQNKILRTTLSYAFCFVCFLPLILLSFNWRVLTLKALQNLFSASDNANRLSQSASRQNRLRKYDDENIRKLRASLSEHENKSQVPAGHLQFDSTTLTFFVNGIRIDVKSIDPRITLAAFLRDKLNLRGTKIGCNEGGCGACIIRECLPFPGVFSVGKAVTTVEGIGGGQKRIHPVQERLFACSWLPCGYCTPGFVMAMYTLLRNKPEPTYAEEICAVVTGYRPILEAFYSFTKQMDKKQIAVEKKSVVCHLMDLLKLKIAVILMEERLITKLSNLCTLPNIESSQELIFPPELTFGAWNQKSFMMENDGYYWYQPVKMEQWLALKREFPNARLMAGNTEIGVELKFRHIDLRRVINIKIFHLFEHFEVKKMDFVQFVDKLPNQKTKIFAEICNILSLFAGNHVRNMATVAGNMATASPISDLNPIWMASAYKQAQRREDDIAIVTGVFSVKFYQNKGPRVESMQMAFGGMGATTRMASKPTQNLKGRIWDEALFNDLSGALADEFRLPENVPGGMAKYRQALVLSFSLKFICTFENSLASHFESTQIYQDCLPSQNKTDPVGRPLMHSSGEKHTTGEAIYTTDVQLPSDCLYMAYVTSPVSCGKIIGNPDYSSALCLDGVIGHVDWRDVPGSLMISHSNDVPLFATDQTSISYHGQPIAAIIANDNETARRAASLVHFFERTKCKQLNRKLIGKKFSRTIKGQIRIGEGDEMHIISSTQSVNDVQGDVATVLGVARNVVTVTVRRIGGGFGGKESCTGLFAGAAAIAAKKFKKPIRFWLERFDDMAISGNRHPFRFDYQFALENDCDKIAAMEVNAYSNCGYSFDLSKGVMERALAHIDNVYKLAMLTYTAICAKQIWLLTPHSEASAFGIDVDTLRELNMYTTEGDITHYGMHLRQCNIRRCWTECQKLSNYDQQKLKLQEWNSKNKYLKRGIYMAGALVHVYTDGSVLISHGGMEMGQGLHTKIQQIASRCLGIDVSMIQIIDTATDKVPNASPTAASVGSDVNGLAVKNACEIILKRLEPLRKELPNESTWKDLVMHAYINRVQLSVTGFATIHCEPVDFTEGRGAEYYSYCVYGVGCAEVEVDCLTGDHRVIRVDIVMDVGESLNPAVDIGQIEGAFVQGFGLFTMEELKIRPDGVRLTRGPGTYKIPSADDAPRQFNVKLLDGSSNKNGIFSSKAIGEPPLFLGSAPFFAIREAIRNYRIQNGNLGYFRLDSPATPERIRLACEDSLLEKAIPQPSKGQRWTTEL
uniref:FAD-binding PCMH-type domain-containing protein n=1 Tax=Globodera rostochiensis TaxID=31243 RepID=A0A914HAN1_GLORO